MKRLLVLGLILVVFCGLLSGCAEGNGANSSSDFKYEIYDGVVTILEYKGKSKNVVIPGEINGNKVTQIGTAAFAEKNIESVKLPNSLLIIGEDSFNKCQSLKTVDFGYGVTTIGKGAFIYCSALEEVILPQGVKNIEQDAFRDCSSLKKVYLPQSVDTLGITAFCNCMSLTDVTIEKGIESLGAYGSFYGCINLEEITIPASVVEISGDIFSNCIALKKVVFAGNAPQISNGDDLGDSTDKVKVYRRRDTYGWDNPKWEKYKLIEY